MAAIKLALVVLCVLAAMAQAAPGGHHSEHHRVIVHVPYKVHTVHHHHVEKYPVYKHVPYPVVKHVPVYKEVHVPVYKHVPYPVPVPVVHKEESHGWSAGLSDESSGHGWL